MISPTPTHRSGIRWAVTTAIVAAVAAVLLAGCDQKGTSDSGYGQPSYQGPSYQGPSYQGPSDSSYGEWRDSVFDQQRDNSLMRQRSY